MRTKLTLGLLVVLTVFASMNVVRGIQQFFAPDEPVIVRASLRDLPPPPPMPPLPPLPDMDAIERDVERATRAAERALQAHEQALRGHMRHEAPNADQEETVIDETFRVDAGDLLEIDVSHADVYVETGSRNEAHVRVMLRARDMERARDYFRDQRYTVEQQGDRVVIRTDPTGRRNWNWNRNGSPEITVVVTVPATFDTDVRTSHGDVHLGDLTGTMELQTSHGDVELAHARGDRLEIRTSHGDIDARTLTGPRVSLRTSHGDIRIDNVEADDFEATTSHGDFRVERATGRIDISNSHGDIRIGLADASQADLQTSHADIVIHAPSRAAADLELRGERVRLASAFAFDGELERDAARGRVNGGGARIEARTTHGDVELRSF